MPDIFITNADDIVEETQASHHYGAQAWLRDLLGAANFRVEPASEQPRRASRRAKAAVAWLKENQDNPFARWLGKVRCYKVTQWVGESSQPGQIPNREEKVVVEADVFSSLLKRNPDGSRAKAHHLVLDIDYPAHLIPSSTEGHFHLVLEVPGGIPHAEYLDLLDILAKRGVIEPGYAAASRERGHSDIRLPWVKKGEA